MKKNIFFLRNLWWLFLLPGLMFAQEVQSISVDHLSEGIRLELSGQSLASPDDYVVIRDSHRRSLALIKAVLDGEQLWIGQNSASPQLPGSIHWQFDEERAVLSIDLSAIDASARTAASILELWVSPVNAHGKQFTLSVFSAAQPGPDSDLNQLTKINELIVELK